MRFCIIVTFFVIFRTKLSIHFEGFLNQVACTCLDRVN